MKIVFVAFGYENLGVEYLSAFLKKKGYNVELVFDPALFKTYHIGNKVLGRIFDYRGSLVRKIINHQPDLVAFSVISDNYMWARDIAIELKKIKRDLVVVFGGIHPSSVPEVLIKEDFIDYVCIGEGEYAFAELIQALESGRNTGQIMNFWCKSGGKIISNAVRPLITDLNTLPLPDKALFYNEYKGFTDYIYMSMTSRGCPYICTYCYNNYLMEIYKGKGPYLRRFSVDRIIDELRFAKQRFKMRRIAFVDDVFTSDEAWLESFARDYRKYIDIPFSCLVHPLFVNKNIVNLLKSSGCTVVGMGIQTLNERIKKEVIRRNESNETVEKAIMLFKKAGILIYVDFILGLPEESHKDIEEGIFFLNRTRPDAVSTLWLRYYPKVEIINIGLKNNIINHNDILNINKALFSSPISSHGSAKSNVHRGAISLLLFSGDLPLAIVRMFIKYNLYKILPKNNLHHLHTLSKQIFNKIIHKKEGYLYSSLRWLMQYYIYYIFGYWRNKFIYSPFANFKQKSKCI